MRKRIGIFIIAFVLALTSGLAVACSEVQVPKGKDKTYTVTYYYNYSGAPSDVYKTEKVNSGTAAKKPTNPTRNDGWTFTEWTKDTAGKSSYNFSTLVNADLKLYAQWKDNSVQPDPKITGIDVTGYKAEYEIGENLVITVKAVYDNGSNEDLAADKYTVTGYDNTKAGDCHVVVALKENAQIKQEFDVKVKPAGEERQLTGIDVTGYKAEYEIGENLVITVKAVYDNGSNEDLAADEYTVTGYDNTQAGDCHVVVALKENAQIKQEFDVTVKAAPVTVTRIEATTTKTTYAKGEALDRTSIIVTAYYSDGTDGRVTGWTVTGYSANTIGSQEITITYQGQPAKLTVTVTAATITDVKITTKPTKLNYEVYDDLDLDGMVVTATLSDETTNPIENYTVIDTEFNNTRAGTYKIEISYEGFKDNFYVTVKMVTYTVEFTVDVDGVTEPADQTINKNGQVQKPTDSDFQRDGYTFLGWFKDEETTPYNFNTPVTEGFTLTAKWSDPIEYTVTYHLEGTVDDAAVVAKIDGKTEYTHKYTIEDDDYDLVEPTVETDGVHFVGWHKGSATGEVITKIAGGSFVDVHVYAEYTKNALVEFIFNHNYGATPKTDKQNVVSGLKAKRPTNPTRTGYTFVEWYEDADCTNLYDFNTVITTETAEIDRTVFAKWNPKTINVTFNPDNGAATFTVPTAYNQKIAAQTDPQKLGHRFDGWVRTNNTAWNFDKTLEEVLASENKEALTLKAKWTVLPYNVVLKPENGSADITIENVTFGTLIPTDDVPANLTKLGHSFEGWFWKDSENNEHEWSFATDKLATEGLTLTAKWKAENYQVKYYNGETLVDTQSVKFGAKVPACTKSVTQTGYHIEGWYDNAGFTGSKWVFGDTATLQTEGLNLYVKWEANEVSVKFVDADNTEYTTYATTAKYDGKVTKPATPTKTGYTFLHWHILDTHTIWVFDGDTFTDEDGNALPVSVVKQTSTLTLQAHWEADTYNITYHMGDYADALTAEAYSKYTYGTAFTLPTAKYVDDNLVNTAGYSFEGWYDNAAFSGDSYAVIPATATGEKEFYAKITQNSKVLFTFNLGYGETSNYPTKNVVIGTTATNIDAPSRTHYLFGGWYTAPNGGGTEYDFNEIVTMETTVYAKWTAVKYTITFDANEGKFVNDDSTESLTKESEFTYEETIVKYAKQPTRVGYTFQYWYVSNENTEYTFGAHPTGDLRLYAKWEINKYTVTLVYNDGVTENGSIENVEYGSTITKPTADPIYPDGSKKFTDWYKDDELTTLWNFDTDTVTSDNVKLYAAWEDKTYTVTFNVNGGVGTVTVSPVKHGGKITKPAEGLVTKTGYHLKKDAEWTLNNGTAWNFATDTVTRPITLNANWEINTYTVTFNSNGGTGVEPKTVNYNEKVKKPTDPSKSGFTFAGWTLSTGGAYNFDAPVVEDLILVATWNGDTGTFLYYTTDGTTWNYGYKAEKNGSGNELVIPRVNISNGMEFRIVTKNDSGSNIVLKAGMTSSLSVKGIFTVAKNGDNFKLTFTNTNYNGSVWTMYVYGLSSGVTVASDGALNKDGTANGVSLVQQHATTKFTPDDEELTSTPVATAAANTIYIPGSFTDGFKLYKEWSNAADGGMLVLKDGNTYTFRHVYLKPTYGFKILADGAWLGGVFEATNVTIDLSSDDAPDIYLGGQFAKGWYDLVFTNGAAKTLVIKPYAEPTVVKVNVTVPQNLTYWRGEPFSTAGFAVSYTDSDGKTYPLSAGYTLSHDLTTITNTVGTKTVTVTYDDVQGDKSFTVTVNALTVTFDPKGGTMADADKVQNVTYNSVATRPANNPTKTGYDLDENWYTDEDYNTPYVFGASGTKVTAPITLYAKWTLHEYQVTFSADGSVIKTVPVTYNTAIPTAQIPDAAKEGNTYVWTRGGVEFDFTTLVTEDLQLTASYTPITYTVTFDYDGYRNNETATVNHGDKVTQPAANKTNRTGYTFNGWYTDDGEKWNFNTDTVTEGLTLTADWTVINYNITYNLEGTVVIDGETVNVSATMPANKKTTYTVEEAFTLATPTVSTVGAHFQEWKIIVDGVPTTAIEAIEKGTTGDIALQAMYTANALVKVTFNYDYTGAPANVERQVTSGTTTSALAASRTGWTFEGWFEKNAEGELANTEFDFATPITADIELCAKWTVHKWKVTFDAKNGYWLGEGDVHLSTKVQTDVEYGSTVTLTDVPTRLGYTFKYWTYNTTELLSTATVTMPDNDITLYAEWQINTYIVKYNVTSTVGDAAVTATKPANATFNGNNPVALLDSISGVTAGYKFIGWTLDGEDITEITLATFGDEKEIELTAKYQIITYSVEYYVDGTLSSGHGGGNPATYKVTDGTDGTVTLIMPSKTGHTFDGWYLEEDYSGEKLSTLTYSVFAGATAENAVPLYGKYTKNKYTVTIDAGEGYWTVEGEQKHQITQEVEYDGHPTRPAQDPDRPGYTFDGWKLNNVAYSFGAEGITGPITITAAWKAAAKVDGLYNGNTLVKELVYNETSKEWAVQFFKVEAATEASPFKAKLYINNSAVTAYTNIKTGSPAYSLVSSSNGELSFKQTGIYSLKYKNTDDTGIWAERHGDVEDYREPNIDEEVDGVYIGGERVEAFTVHTGNYNQVKALSVQVTAANNTTAVEVTFKYAGEDVTLTKVDTAEGITNIGTNETVKLYSGTYNFYYNYGKNGDGKAGRLWIEGTQTGGINLGTTAVYVAGSFNGWANAVGNAAYKFDSNGVMELDFNTGDLFKIVKGSTWLGYDQLSITANAALYENAGGNDHNIKIKSGGTYQLIFDGSKLTITKVVIEAPNIAVGKYIVLGKQPKELTAADKFTAASSTCYKIEFEISETTVVKIWNQTSATAGNYEVVSEVHLNGGAKIEPVDTTMQAGKYRLEYNVYDNGAWVRLDFTKEIAMETTNQLKGTKFVLTGSDTSITIYLANADGTGATLSQYKIWVWDTPSGNLYGTTDADSGWSKRPTVTATMTTSKALGDKISFKFTKDSSESNNLENIATGKTYVITIGTNLQLTIQEYVAA